MIWKSVRFVAIAFGLIVASQAQRQHDQNPAFLSHGVTGRVGGALLDYPRVVAINFQLTSPAVADGLVRNTAADRSVAVAAETNASIDASTRAMPAKAVGGVVWCLHLPWRDEGKRSGYQHDSRLAVPSYDLANSATPLNKSGRA